MNGIRSVFFALVVSIFTMTPAHAVERTVVKTARIEASASEVWAPLTTSAGLKSFLGIDSTIELRVGGKYEYYFGPPEAAPNRGSEGCTILSYLPQRMLSFTWNAPPSIPAIRALGASTFVVVEFTAAGENATDVRLTHLGWGDGPEWDKAYTYFDRAWGAVLGALQKSKAPSAADFQVSSVPSESFSMPKRWPAVQVTRTSFSLGRDSAVRNGIS